MVQNIGKVLQRGENLDDLQNRSDDLNVTVIVLHYLKGVQKLFSFFDSSKF